MATLTMPQLGESVTEGTILQWLKQPGDAVALDEPLVEIETEKVTVEIPSPFAGVVEALLVAEGETVEVGTPLAEITSAGAVAVPSKGAPSAPGPSKVAPSAAAAVPTRAPAAAPAAAPAVAAVAAGVAEERAPVAEAVSGDGAGTYAKRRYSPAVARLAAERGIDPGALSGTGRGGRVTRKDVIAAVASPAAAPAAVAATAAVGTPVTASPADVPGTALGAEDSVIELTPIRRRIAQNMVRSKFTAPHAWLVMETDVTEMVRLRSKLREEFRASEGADLTYMAFAAKAICRALHAYPSVNASWDGEQLIQRHQVNLGVAVDTEDGLIVPVIHDADRMNVAALAVAIADVAARARRRRLTLNEVQGGTFTLDNTGIFGTVASAPIINYPQVAILTTEAVVKRPVVVQGDAIAVRSMMNICLSFDHRAMDGSTAAGFTAHVRDGLQSFDAESSVY